MTIPRDPTMCSMGGPQCDAATMDASHEFGTTSGVGTEVCFLLYSGKDAFKNKMLTSLLLIILFSCVGKSFSSFVCLIHK